VNKRKPTGCATEMWWISNIIESWCWRSNS